MFLIDVQPDQAEGVRAFLRGTVSRPGGEPRSSLCCAHGLRGVRGQDADPGRLRGRPRARRRLGREYVVTYRAALERQRARSSAGTFWPAAAAATARRCRSSRAWRDRQGHAPRRHRSGSTSWAGPSRRRVTSIRKVDWADARAGGFMFVFRPGVLESAPGTFVAPVNGPGRAGGDGRASSATSRPRSRMCRSIDVQEILAGVARGARHHHAGGDGGRVAGACRRPAHPDRIDLDDEVPAHLRGGGAQDARRHHRPGGGHAGRGVRPARRWSRVRSAPSGRSASSWAVSRFVLEVPWRPRRLDRWPRASRVPSATVAVVGVLASLDVLRRKPLATLRAE